MRDRRTYQNRELSLLALLAGINCIFESTMGNFLHLMHFPLTGFIMCGVNIVIYIIARLIRPKPGTITIIALITATGNLAAGGTFKPLAIAAIILEGILFDIIISFLGNRKWSFVVAAMCVYLFSFVYPFLTALFFIKKEPVNAFYSLLVRNGNQEISMLAIAFASVLMLWGLIFAGISCVKSALKIVAVMRRAGYENSSSSVQCDILTK
jgi:ABC-type thiamin/hydroxymethylpyrimidine transport system permease subunit